jgi:hypothetical protein
VTCRFDGSPKIFLTDWLEFWLGPLCDVDHMESSGVWCRPPLSSVGVLTRAFLGAAPGHALGDVLRGLAPHVDGREQGLAVPPLPPACRITAGSTRCGTGLPAVRWGEPQFGVIHQVAGDGQLGLVHGLVSFVACPADQRELMGFARPGGWRRFARHRSASASDRSRLRLRRAAGHFRRKREAPLTLSCGPLSSANGN